MFTAAATPLIALCASTDSRAIAQGPVVELALAAEGAAPEWIQIFPQGPNLHAVDGRSWTLTDPADIVAAFARTNLELPIDYEHAQDRLAPKGEAAPASGWISKLEVRDGLLWGRVAWTPKGAASVAAREYRYFSPAFAHDKAGRVFGLAGGALVNRPAFQMPALAAASDANEEQSEKAFMDKIIAALGLAAGVSEAAIITAIEGLKTERTTALASAQTPDLAKFVPRADYEIALARATTAEASIEAGRKATRDAEIARAVDAAIADGKIAPPSRDFYMATCGMEGGLEKFKAFAAATPSLFKKTDLDKRDPDARTDGGVGDLTPEMIEVARMMGTDVKALAASIAASTHA